jgi:hypothetical protein
MQGIFLGRASNLGFKNVVIRNNVVTVGYWHGIAVYDGQNVTVTGNRVLALPGSVAPMYPFARIRPWIKIENADNLRGCDNFVEAWPDGEGTSAC